jgi:hypothetical protein
VASSTSSGFTGLTGACMQTNAGTAGRAPSSTGRTSGCRSTKRPPFRPSDRRSRALVAARTSSSAAGVVLGGRERSLPASPSSRVFPPTLWGSGCATDTARGRWRHPLRAVETSAQVEWVINRVAQVVLVRNEAARSRERFVKAAAERLRDAMREALNQPERSPVLAWAIPDVLAITQRPLRAHAMYGGSRRNYPAAARPAIEEWLRRLGEQRIQSIVVLTSDRELAHYDAPTAPEGGLLAIYATRGLEIAHFPADDPAHDVTAREAFAAAVDGIADRVGEALARLPLPAVMHCSAAIDRSPPVAARIEFITEVGGLSLS